VPTLSHATPLAVAQQTVVTFASVQTFIVPGGKQQPCPSKKRFPQTCPCVVQVPHEPPQPSSPHVLFVQSGMHIVVVVVEVVAVVVVVVAQHGDWLQRKRQNASPLHSNARQFSNPLEPAGYRCWQLASHAVSADWHWSLHDWQVFGPQHCPCSHVPVPLSHDVPLD
jgi:hypothetical protein